MPWTQSTLIVCHHAHNRRDPQRGHGQTGVGNGGKERLFDSFPVDTHRNLSCLSLAHDLAQLLLIAIEDLIFAPDKVMSGSDRKSSQSQIHGDAFFLDLPADAGYFAFVHTIRLLSAEQIIILATNRTFP